MEIFFTCFLQIDETDWAIVTGLSNVKQIRLFEQHVIKCRVDPTYNAVFGCNDIWHNRSNENEKSGELIIEHKRTDNKIGAG